MTRIVKAIICMFIMSLLTVAVFAEEKTQAELLQEMMMNGDTGENAEDVADSNFTPVEDDNTSTVGGDLEPVVEVPSEPTDPNETATIIELVNRIDELDPRQPDINEVDTLISMYNSLSELNKLSVTNYDKLEEAKKIADVNYSKDNPTPTPEPELTPIVPQVHDDPEVLDSATQYLVTIKKPVTVTARFTVDENYDGLIDVPKFTLLGPGGYSFLVDSTKLEVKNDGIDMTCSWIDRDFVQFDILNAVEGQWQFESSLPVTYELSDYKGPIPKIEPIETPAPDDDPTPMPRPSYGRAIVIGAVIFIGIILMVGVILVMNKVDILSPITNRLKDITSSNSNNNKSKGKYMNDDDDYGASLTDEQIMAQIKKEYEEQKAKEEKMQEEARQEQVQEKYEKENEMTDDHMYETRFDYDDEEEALDEEDLELDDTENEGADTKKPRPPRFT